MNSPAPRGLHSERETLLRELLGTAQEPLLALDSELRLVMASDAFFQEFDVLPHDSAGSSFFELADGLWDEPGARELLEVLAPKQPAVEGYLLFVRPRDGVTRAYTANVRPLRSGANRIDLFLLSLSPAAPGPASALGGGESLARLVAEHSADAVALYDSDGVCRYVGAAVEAVLGYPPQQWMRLDPLQLLHPAERDRLRSTIRALHEGDAHRATFRVRRRGGEYLWLDAALRSVPHDHYGQLLLVAARDVTARTRSEEALRWLSRQTRLILDSAGEGIFGVDAHGVVTFANPAACRLLAQPASELMGRPHDLFSTSGDGTAAQEIAETLRDGLPRWSNDRTFLRGDGQPLAVEYSCTPARQGDDVVGAVITFRDVTERRRADAALRRAEWLAGVGETVLALRHEINNPLTTLLAETSMLLMGDNAPHDEREMLESIAEQARRIRDVVRRLVELQGDPPVRNDGETRMLDLSP